ncbi:MAG TPA: ribosome recycling factor [Parachlamydiaceae bacterium]|nr:ribosome recycling factor [Parachlamydiaceae bacterium]
MNQTEQTKAKMLAALEHLKTELKSIRTGRANPGMVEGVMVEVYGSPMRLKEIASINAPESRMLVITPFDSKLVGAIGKGIEKANIGVNPIVDGNMVRIKIAQMDENVRKEMVKLCHKRLEEAKISIRNIRREGNDAIRKQKSAGDIAEDVMKKTEKSIQELTDKYCKEAEDLTEKKEKEVSSI